MIKSNNITTHLLTTGFIFFCAVITLYNPSLVNAYYKKSYGIPPAIYTSWSGGWDNEPIYGMTGYDNCPVMSQVWDAPQSVNWSSYDFGLNQARVTAAKSLWPKQPISLVIPPQEMNLGGDGTAENPFNNMNAPEWAKNMIMVVKTENHSYNVWNYAALQPHAVWFVTEAGKKYNKDNRVGVVRLWLGFQAETQPIKDCESYWSNATLGCKDTDPYAALKALAQIPWYCDAYRDYIFEVGKAAALAFPDKPVIVNAAPTGCSNWSSTRWKSTMFERWINDTEMKQAGV